MIPHAAISDYLIEHNELVPAGFLIVALASFSVGYLLTRRSASKRTIWGLFGLACIPILALALSPASGEPEAACEFAFSLPTPGRVELVANIALFIPAATLATLASRRPLLVLAASLGATVAIEAVQAAIPAIGRSCDTKDGAMNLLGAAIGVLLGLAASAIARGRS